MEAEKGYLLSRQAGRHASTLVGRAEEWHLQRSKFSASRTPKAYLGKVPPAQTGGFKWLQKRGLTSCRGMCSSHIGDERSVVYLPK